VVYHCIARTFACFSARCTSRHYFKSGIHRACTMLRVAITYDKLQYSTVNTKYGSSGGVKLHCITLCITLYTVTGSVEKTLCTFMSIGRPFFLCVDGLLFFFVDTVQC
jgi:hypothetical protein